MDALVSHADYGPAHAGEQMVISFPSVGRCRLQLPAEAGLPRSARITLSAFGQLTLIRDNGLEAVGPVVDQTTFDQIIAAADIVAVEVRPGCSDIVRRYPVIRDTEFSTLRGRCVVRLSRAP
jgi:hypothetical protein